MVVGVVGAVRQQPVLGLGLGVDQPVRRDLERGRANPTLAVAWRIAQGVEMGRPSLLEASAIKRGGEVATVRIGGRSVMVCEGWIEVGDASG